MYCTNLTLVLLVINMPFEKTGFSYGENTIFGYFQINCLVATLFLTGFVDVLMWPLSQRSRNLASFLMILTTLFSFGLIYVKNGLEEHNFGYLSYKVAPNHTISIKAQILSSSENSPVCGFIHSLSQIMDSKHIQNLQIVKIESLSDLQKIKHFPFLLMVIVKSGNPYLPASKIKRINTKFTVVQVSSADWHLVRHIYHLFYLKCLSKKKNFQT